MSITPLKVLLSLPSRHKNNIQYTLALGSHMGHPNITGFYNWLKQTFTWVSLSSVTHMSKNVGGVSNVMHFCSAFFSHEQLSWGHALIVVKPVQFTMIWHLAIHMRIWFMSISFLLLLACKTGILFYDPCLSSYFNVGPCCFTTVWRHFRTVESSTDVGFATALHNLMEHGSNLQRLYYTQTGMQCFLSLGSQCDNSLFHNFLMSLKGWRFLTLSYTCMWVSVIL